MPDNIVDINSKIVGAFRIKNEERWIRMSLEAASSVCDEIVILDDDSTDDTVKICKEFEKVVDIHHQSNLPFDESRDKNSLLQMALKRNPDFIMILDGDQVLQPDAKKILLEDIHIIYPDAEIFEFQLLDIWDKPNQYRYDGSSSNIWIKKLIRMSKQPKNLYFSTTKYPGNAHCPSIPQNSTGLQNSVRSRMKIFHYGKYDAKLRQQKYDFYTKLDPNNADFDNYVHVNSGKGRFSGPKGIEVKLIPDKIFYPDIQ